MYEEEMNEIDIRFEKIFLDGVTISTPNTTLTKYLLDLLAFSFVVSAMTFIFVFAALGQNIDATAVLKYLVTWGISFLVSVGAFIPWRVLHGKRCEHCQTLLPEIYSAAYCDNCSERFGFGLAEDAARKQILKSLTEYHAGR